MRLLFCISFTLCAWFLQGQSYFPVKQQEGWKLMNTRGVVWEKDQIDAVHMYDELDYIIYQKNNQVGLIHVSGEILIQPIYTDIRPVSAYFVELGQSGTWTIGKLDGTVVFKEKYEAISGLSDELLLYKQEGKWGCLHTQKGTLIEPKFDLIEWDSAGFFVVQKKGHIGIMSADGLPIVSVDKDEIIWLEDKAFAYRIGSNWGFCNTDGTQKSGLEFNDFTRFNAHFLQVKYNGSKGFGLLSIESFKLAPFKEIKSAYTYSKGEVVFSVKSGKIGLLNINGELVIPPQYQEIASFTDSAYRVKSQNTWAVISKDMNIVYPFEYSFISPPNGKYCILVKGKKTAVGDVFGQLISDFKFDQIQWGNNREMYCYQGTSMSVMREEQGQLIGSQSFDEFLQLKIAPRQTEIVRKDGYQLEAFEWVFVADNNKWGLRNKVNASFQLTPQFDDIQVFDDLGFTLVMTRKSVPFSISKVNFQFLNIFQLVNNKSGHKNDEELVHIYLEDFEAGHPMARCIFKDLSFGLVDQQGHIIQSGFQYIGPYEDGMLAASSSGKIQGSLKVDERISLGGLNQFLEGLMANFRMTDYTEYAQEFLNKAAYYCPEGYWGFLDTTSHWKIPPIYDFAVSSRKGVGIVVQDGKWGVVKEKGVQVLDFNYDHISFLEKMDLVFLQVEKQEIRYGVIDSLGNEVIPFKFEALGSLDGDLVPVKKNGLWGFIDQGGMIVIGCAFNEVRPFSDGLAAVRNGNKWGFINKQGQLSIGIQYNRCGDFIDNVCWVYEQSKAYYIDQSGQKIFQKGFDQASNFSAGLARVKLDGRVGLINTRGDYVLKPKYLQITDFNAYGVAIAESPGNQQVRFDLIDTKGNVISNLRFSEIRPFKEGFAAVRIKKHWGFVNKNGHLIAPVQYFNVGDFSCGRAAVYKNGKCGYIDYSGMEVLPLDYNGCSDFEADRAVVKMPRLKDGVINKEGTVIIKPGIHNLFSFSEGRGLVRDRRYRYYFITENATMYDGFYQSAQKFQHGVAPVKSKGSWGLINLKGMWISQPKYSALDRLSNGCLLAKTTGLKGIANLNGEFLAPLDYLRIQMVSDNIFLLETGHRMDYLTFDGNWLWKSD